MLRRMLLGVLLAASWAGGTVLGIASAALRTNQGREAVVHWGVRVANERLAGSLVVGRVGGSFFGGLAAGDVTLRDADGAVVASVDTVRLQYRVRDLVRGRFTFGALALVRPSLDLVQWAPGEPWNVERVAGARGGGGGDGISLAFAGVTLRGGTVVIRSPMGPTDSAVAEVEAGPRGPLRVRRFSSLEARLPRLQVSSGDDAARFVASVAGFTVSMTDPLLVVVNARGRVLVWGDSIRFELAELAFPETRTTLDGAVSWPEGNIRYDLAGAADEVFTDDVRGFIGGLPPGLVGRLDFASRTEPDGAIRVDARDIALEGRPGGGTLRGRLGMLLGPDEGWGFERTELQLDRFDLEYVRGYVNTLPVGGTYTGSLSMDGPSDALRVAFDGTFRDVLVDGTPRTTGRGEGVLALSEQDGVTFRDFVLEDADVALSTVTRLMPAMLLRGRLAGAGTLNGPWRAATFDGELRYRDGDLPESHARGAIRLDARGELLDVRGELAFDSLDLASFHSSFPGLTVTGTWAGSAALDGRLDSLRVAGRLSGLAGTIEAEGALRFLDDERAFPGLTLTFERLDLALLDPRSPPTDLTGTLVLDGTLTPRERRTVRAEALLAASEIRNVPLDSASALVRIASEDLTVDRLEAWSNGSKIEVGGGVALAEGVRDTLEFRVTLQTLAAAEPLLAEWIGPLDVSESSPLPSGSMRVTGRLQGVRSNLLLVADWEADDVRRGDMILSHGGGVATWVTASRSLRLEGTVDSVEMQGRGLGDVVFRVHGRPDSLSWFGRSRFGAWGAWIGGGTILGGGTSRTVRLDSLGILLVAGPWFARPGAVIAVDDSGATVTGLEFTQVRSQARVRWNGRLPFRGVAAVTAAVEAFPVEDLWLLLGRDYELVSGAISGTVQMGGTARAPVLDVALDVRDGVFGEFRAPHVQSVLAYADGRLSGEVQFWRRGEQILDVDVDLPLDLALAGGARRRRIPGQLRVHATAAGVDLSLLEPTVPVARQMGGTLDADFGVAGTWEQPELTGTITVRDGAATFPALGVRHEAMNGVLVLSGDTIHVERFSVRSGPGSGTVSGFVRLEELSRPVLHLDVAAANFRAIDVPDFLTLTASADLAFRGPFYGATLTGEATATRGALYFADLLTKDIVNLQDTLFAEFVDTTLVRRQGLGAALQIRFLDSLRIDSLRVDMGSEFWMRSSEANIQLAGAVFASKVRDRYRLDGTLQAPRGTYRLRLGFTTREFTVTGGTVRYLGTPDLNADLDIQAEHVVRTVRGEDVDVFVTIGGTLWEPQLQLASSIRPALAETEIISYLLFGAPSVQAGAGATGFQSRLISQQIFGALSSQLEYSLISDLGVPLDYVQIRPAAAGDLTAWELAAGKQFSVLGTTAFLSASPQLCPRAAGQFLEHIGASLEFRLSRKWLLAASLDPVRSCESLTVPVGVDYQLGVDLFWETSY